MPVARVVASALAILFGASCGAYGSQAGPPYTLVIAQAWEPHTLNPLLHIDYNAYELDNLVYSMLLQQDGGGRLVPDLALNVPSSSNGQISPDGRRIVYHLRRDVRWQDGKPLTSADVAFSYRAVMNPRTAVPSRDGYDDVEGIEAPDPYTVVVRLKRRFSSFLSFFFARVKAIRYSRRIYSPAIRASMKSRSIVCRLARVRIACSVGIVAID
jgi:peptide/nickel transport system substrate-binding protein